MSAKTKSASAMQPNPRRSRVMQHPPRPNAKKKKSAMQPNASGHAYPKQGHATSAAHKREKTNPERHACAKQCHAKSSHSKKNMRPLSFDSAR